MSIENGKGDHKKTVGAAVSPSFYLEIRRQARRRGVTISTLIKQALEQQLCISEERTLERNNT